MIIKDLGAVSAYAYAVEKGYTGTEEEFATLMASYATVAEEAAESAESASQSASTASASAQTATSKANEATTAAQTATAKAEEAQADADAAALDASQALSAASTATSKASEAAQSASDAATAKTAAQTAQTAAEGSATTAQTGAQTATQKAAEAAESARTLTIDTTLTQSGQAADSKVVGDIVNKIYEANPAPIDVSAIDGINVKAGYNASDSSTSIAMSANSNYNSYWFIADKDIDIWVDNISATYFAIVVGNGAYTNIVDTDDYYRIYCTGGSTRYRKSDNNLPTESNKLHVPAGYPIAFTITAGRMDKVYGLDSNYSIKDSFKQEVLTASPDSKKPKIKYINGNGEGSSTERFEIYIPSTVGYVRYDFVHSVNQAKNADNWRINNAYAVSDNLSQRFALTTSGEWEAAIHLDERSDFSGGIAHGDEVFTSLVVFVDGKHVDHTTLTDIQDFKEVRIVEVSNMYDPADSVTQICVHGSEHIFNDDGLTINQNIIWSTACTVTTCYLAMFPPAKFTSDKLYTDINYEAETLPASNYRHTYAGVKNAVIYNEGNGFWAEFSIPKYPTGMTGGDYLWVLDNGGLDYNKMYYVVTTGTTVQANDIWRNQTVYNLDVSI